MSPWSTRTLRVFLRATTVMVAIGGASAPLHAADKKTPASLLPGAGSREPISIDAGKLDFFNKEQKLVYSGGVVAVQGDSTLKGSELVIYLAKDPQKPGTGEAAAAAATVAGGTDAATPAAEGSSVRHMDVKGPVTLISKDQVGTGDSGSYDKTENKVTLSGNVTLSQGTNVTKGDRLVYDLTSGQAQVFSGQTYGRVKSLFTPGSAGPEDPLGGTPKKKAPAKAKPAGTASTQ